MRTLYFDCFAGASGNMILGALIAAGVEKDALLSGLKALQVPDFDLEVTTVDRAGISSTHVKVEVPHEHNHRHLSEIAEIISESSLTALVKSRAVSIFTRLAQAEAKVHGVDVQKVHFHEVGALDAIIDVVGACIGFEILGIERFASSSIHVGSGFVNMAHGKFPVPPPAVVELLRNFPIYSTEIEGELTTPTGAAIISTLCETCGRLPKVKGEAVGYGAGSRNYDGFPNALRVVIGESQAAGTDSFAESEAGAFPTTTMPSGPDRLILIETNIDDLAPQILGFVMDRAFALGALDCWFTPIQMKKNRPATMLSILCEEQKRESMTELLYQETTTLGIRIRETQRHQIEREVVRAETQFGAVDVKIGRMNGRIVNVMPEYEHVRSLALKNNVPFRVVRDAVLAALEKKSIAAGK